jgi:hypothetical protein
MPLDSGAPTQLWACVPTRGPRLRRLCPRLDPIRSIVHSPTVKRKVEDENEVRVREESMIGVLFDR